VDFQVLGVDGEPVFRRVAARSRVPPHAEPGLLGQSPQQDDGIGPDGLDHGERRVLRSGGFIVIGLYNTYGRRLLDLRSA